jgi:hypothetical protein
MGEIGDDNPEQRERLRIESALEPISCRDRIKKERLENPDKRDRHLRNMTEASEQITAALERDTELKHTRLEDSEKFCERNSCGQQAAELADEAFGIEGIDF